MPSDDAVAVLADLWRRQSSWSAAAGQTKSQVSRYRLVSLLLVVSAAILATAAPAIATFNDAAGRVSGLVAGTALALLPLVRARLGIGIYQTWSRLRSVSEAIKSETYTFLAGVHPYRGDDRMVILRQRSREITAMGDDLLDRVSHIRPKHRALPPVHDVDSYLLLRVTQQAEDYYRANARVMARRARLVRVASAYLAVLAALLGVAASVWRTELAPWIGVVGTITGAVIAHSAAARYAFLQLEYLRTAEQLERIVDVYRDQAPSPERDDRLVADCERVISFQNEAWMAELVTTRLEDPEATIPPPL